MPISFSALCIISLVMRSGVGDGRGEGEAAGVGIWANAVNGDFETARPAAPAAGSSFTKLRRLMLDLLLVFGFVSFMLILRINERASNLTIDAVP